MKNVLLSIRLRQANRADLSVLVMLENRVFTSDRMSARQWRHHIDSKSAHVEVAVVGQVVAGSTVLFFRQGSGIARLYSIAVAPEMGGQGLGKMLLQKVEHVAKSHGCRCVQLEVRLENVGAQRLYERMGYQPFGLKRHFYEDGQDALRYKKYL